MTDFPTFSYTLPNVTPTLWYTWSLEKLSLRAEVPRIGHYREYPLPLGGGGDYDPGYYDHALSTLVLPYFVVNTGTQIRCK